VTPRCPSSSIKALALHRSSASMGWTIGRLTSKQHGIPKGLPYLMGFVIHCEITEDALVD